MKGENIGTEKQTHWKWVQDIFNLLKPSSNFTYDQV
jgi:hypothetical protein